jgi:riboflavin synthase
MFTGLITHIGKIKKITFSNQDAVISIESPPDFLTDVKIGDSIAVSGPCLTVTSVSGNTFSADISGETLNRTTIPKWQSGKEVNLEKSLAASGRLGGHFVMGHIDGTARLSRINKQGSSSIYFFETEPDIAKMIVPKGSVSIDGVSLTPASKENSIFGIAVIPHTLDKTTLKNLKLNDRVNVEVDIFGRYIFEFMKSLSGTQSVQDLDINTLRSEGY